MSIELVEALVGNKTAARVLMYVQNYGEGYASAMARTFSSAVNPFVQQLDRLERGGILVQRPYGRTRVYTWNPCYPFKRELQALLERALDMATDQEADAYFMERRRPRLKGKPYAIIEQD